MSIVLNMCSTP